MTTPSGPAPDIAKLRFIVIQAVRWIGVALVMLGLAIIAGRIDLPTEAGYALLVAGAIDALVLPIVLARRWKSPGA